jgi:hypothetical protein
VLGQFAVLWWLRLCAQHEVVPELMLQYSADVAPGCKFCVSARRQVKDAARKRETMGLRG